MSAPTCHLGPPEIGPHPKHATCVFVTGEVGPLSPFHGPDKPSWPGPTSPRRGGVPALLSTVTDGVVTQQIGPFVFFFHSPIPLFVFSNFYILDFIVRSNFCTGCSMTAVGWCEAATLVPPSRAPCRQPPFPPITRSSTSSRERRGGLPYISIPSITPLVCNPAQRFHSYR